MTLTKEQLDAIEQNRQNALKRLAERKMASQGSSQPGPTASSTGPLSSQPGLTSPYFEQTTNKARGTAPSAAVDTKPSSHPVGWHALVLLPCDMHLIFSSLDTGLSLQSTVFVRLVSTGSQCQNGQGGQGKALSRSGTCRASES